MKAEFTVRKMRFQPTQSAGQPGLFEEDKTAAGRDLRGPLVEGDSDSEREPIGAEIENLPDRPKPGAVWNGQIWVTDDDIPF